MGGDKVLQYIQTFTEVRLNRQFDSTTGCICHQSTHTSQLFDLFIRTTGSGVRHHEDIVQLIQSIQQIFCNLIIGFLPCIHNGFVTLFLCQQTTAELLGNNFHCILCTLKKFFLTCRHFHIRNRYRHSCFRRIFVSKGFNIVQSFCRLSRSLIVDTFFQNLFQLFLSNMEIHFQLQEVIRIASVYKSQILTDDLIENKSS